MRLYRHRTLDSTNLEARRLWQGGAGRFGSFAVVADEQTNGIGRDGRPWKSLKGGLWMTVGWRCEDVGRAAQGLPLVAGLAVARVLEELYQIKPAIKWPNDILVNNRKLCGVLCQADSALRPPGVFVGIGIDANFSATDLGAGLRRPATTLRDELGREVDLQELTEALLGLLERLLGDYERRGFNPSREAINERLAWRGHLVSGERAIGHQPIHGRLLEVDGVGRLMLETEAGVVALSSGEVGLLHEDAEQA